MNFYQNRGNYQQQQQSFFRPNFNQNQPTQNQQPKFNYFYQDPRTNPKPKPVPMSGISYQNMPKNNNAPNNGPRFIPNQNFKPQQINPQRPNYFQNVGHYPDFSFEELNHNDIHNDEYFDENQSYSDDSYYENTYPDNIPFLNDETLQFEGQPENTFAPETRSRENTNFHEAIDQIEKT